MVSISRDVFESVKQTWGGYASWAVWQQRMPGEKPTVRVGDLTVLDPDLNPSLLATLNPEVVMVGLNAADREVMPAPWGNFHDPRPVSKDFKIRFAFEQTPWWGAYMTDVIKGINQTNSKQVVSYLRQHPDEISVQIARFRQELKDTGAVSPLLLVFGGDAWRIVSRYLRDDYQMIKLRHYSDYSSQETYRDQVISAINVRLLDN